MISPSASVRQTGKGDDDASCLPQSLRYFLLAAFGLTIVSLGYSWIARQLGYGLPYSFTYLLIPGAFFSDFSEFLVRFSHFGTPTFFHQNSYFMYPPALVLPIEAFYATPHPLKFFLLFLLGMGVFFAVCFYRILRKHGLRASHAMLLTSGTVITSYPYLLLLQRWNTEAFIWLLVTTGIWSFYRGRYSWAAICFGLATSFKVYPVVFFGLFLPRKRYLEILFGALTAVASTLVALRSLSSDIAYAFRWDKTQLEAFGKYYAAAPHNLGYDHSFLAFVKFVTLPWHPDLTFLVRPYTWIVALGCLLLYFGRIWKMPVVNQILCLSVLSTCIAPISYDYTLLTLYAPFAILCLVALTTSVEQQPRLLPLFLLLAVVFTPLNFVIYNGAVFGAQLRILALVALLAFALAKPLPAEISPA